MFTDMVGYTKMAQRNEELAVGLLEAQRNHLRPIFQKHNGHEIDTIGDGFLVLFTSALDAVKCSLEIQGTLKKMNERRTDEMKILLRIGVHLGDIIDNGKDISGDAVNVASRIEPLAEPGCICVTGEVYHSVVNKIKCDFEPLIKPNLKNVSTPIEVFRIMEGKDGIFLTSQSISKERNRLAVLPFVNMSPDPNDAYFADGMTEEMISTVSGISGLNVISRTSVMGYKGTTKKLGEIGNELKVSSVLEGSIRKAGNRIRITAQLIDVEKDDHLWAKSYDRELDDVFAIQSDIAGKIAESLKVHLLATGKSRIQRVPTKNISAYDNYLRGVHIMQNRTGLYLSEAKTFFEKAIAQDSDFSQAYAVLGNLYVSAAGDYLPMKEAFEKAEPLIAKALELDPNSSEARLAKGNLALQSSLDYDTAERELKFAIELNPLAHLWCAIYQTVIGNTDKALASIQVAQELDPLSLEVKETTGFIYATRRDWPRAMESTENLLQIQPENKRFLLSRIALNYRLGRVDEAKRQLEIFRQSKMNLPDESTVASYLALLGNFEESRAMLGKIESRRSGGEFLRLRELALIYAALGEIDRAMDLLEEEFEQGPGSLLFFQQMSAFDPLRKNLRFKSLVSKLHLPQRSTST
jgi:adenylate cyclase